MQKDATKVLNKYLSVEFNHPLLWSILYAQAGLNVNLPELEFEESSNSLKVWGCKLLSMEGKGMIGTRLRPDNVEEHAVGEVSQ